MSDSDSDESIDETYILPLLDTESGRMVTGQAISDLSSTVKELMDNALDSGARTVNIRLFNHGVDVIEVSDDGSGIPSHSRALVAMNHATSKIRSFNDLQQDTYNATNGRIQPKHLGFRGGALFSISNMSQNLIISTRTDTDPNGQRFEFGREGYLNQNSLKDCQRKIGTTVAVVKIFDTHPDRREEMMKRIKVQRLTMVRLIQSYAVLRVGVRFNLTDISGPLHAPTNSEVTLNTSEGSKSLMDTTSAVFGSKFLESLCPVHVDLSPVVARREPGNVDTQNQLWKIEGLVSMTPNSSSNGGGGGGGGKITGEIQFFSVNGRPVECPFLTKVVYDVWRNFEYNSTVANDERQRKRRPVCILHIFLPSTMLDLNLIPSKRQILLTDEKVICAMFRDSLINLWNAQTSGTFSSAKNKVVENSETTTPLEEKSPKRAPDNVVRRKVRRRNGFYIDSMNIGTNAPDGEHEDDEYNNSGSTTFSPERAQWEPQQDSIEPNSFDRDRQQTQYNTLSFQPSETQVVNHKRSWTEEEIMNDMSSNSFVQDSSYKRPRNSFTTENVKNNDQSNLSDCSM